MEQTVSVVIPVHNGAKTLKRAIDSALSQTLPVTEIIVVDDFSSDGSHKLVLGYESDRVRLIRLSENLGGGVARSKGIRAAKAAWIAFLDCDDYWRPEKNEHQFAAVRASGFENDVVCYSAIEMLTVSGSTYSPAFAWNESLPLDQYLVPMKQYMQTSGLIVKSELAKSTMFNPDLKKHQDIDFVLRLKENGAKFIFSERADVVYDNTDYCGRVSTSKTPERTQHFIEVSGSRLSEATKAFYNLTVVAPMTAMREPGKSFRLIFRWRHWIKAYKKEIIESFVFYNTNQSFYNKLRVVYRQLRGKK